jgi:ribosomal protein S18 acetylase RimI-like enzyme
MTQQPAAIRIEQAATPAHFAEGRTLFEEYAAALGVDLCFQNFEQELVQLATMYAPPDGCLLLARHDAALLGCVGLRRHRGDVCEMKRLYVRPSARGQRLGWRLTEAILGRARELGYRRMLLDTLPSMQAARRLYDAFGFREATGYYDNPVDGVVYMACELG